MAVNKNLLEKKLSISYADGLEKKGKSIMQKL